ncbi:hypothetical protein [Biostraticola tofi]|uniref:Winged helix-turn-helix DNA-binding protein n=1 Tax=Biostraticola tofi TaxID=466109 RepID=A0A4R3Z3L1_9GAMM|nr:hypothetical protein [Biostraticola tofi]TCW00414.1 hypothetical protein EDC52_101764 [Biostraticola tofi]
MRKSKFRELAIAEIRNHPGITTIELAARVNGHPVYVGKVISVLVDDGVITFETHKRGRAFYRKYFMAGTEIQEGIVGGPVAPVNPMERFNQLQAAARARL